MVQWGAGSTPYVCCRPPSARIMTLQISVLIILVLVVLYGPLSSSTYEPFRARVAGKVQDYQRESSESSDYTLLR